MTENDDRNGLGSHGGFHALVGNPPFLAKRRTATAGDRRDAELRRFVTGGAASSQADSAAVFLARSAALLASCARLGLVLPRSVLSARHALAARARVLERASLFAVWTSRERLFDAGTAPCAVFACRGGTAPAAVARTSGIPPESLPDAGEQRSPETWGHLTAEAAEIPGVTITVPSRPLADVAFVTADFRDEYYGLRGAVAEACDAPDDAPRLITSGLIDLARSRWGERGARILRSVWSRPVALIDRLGLETEQSGKLRAWARSRLVPKILVATQTRVIEAACDTAGRWLPVTPVVTVAPHDPSMVTHLAAVLASPVVAACAARSAAGTGLVPGAIKLSAGQLGALPIPSAPSGAWDIAARAFAAGDLDTWERAACEAYGIEDPGALLAWYRPRRRGRGSALA